MATWSRNAYQHRAKLTKREQEICDLTLKGMSRKEIATQVNQNVPYVTRCLNTTRAQTFLNLAREQLHEEALHLVTDSYKAMIKNLMAKMGDPKTAARDVLDGFVEITDRLQIAGLLPQAPTATEGAADFGLLIAPEPAPKPEPPPAPVKDGQS